MKRWIRVYHQIETSGGKGTLCSVNCPGVPDLRTYQDGDLRFVCQYIRKLVINRRRHPECRDIETEEP